MSYYIKVWSTQNETGDYSTLTADIIIDIQIDDNASANDDPFEVVGRSMKATLHKSDTVNQFIASLTDYDIPSGSDDTGNTLYNRNFFKNLIQVIDDTNGHAVFTGLIGRDSIRYDLKSLLVDFTVYDSLYIWIMLCQGRNAYLIGEGILDIAQLGQASFRTYTQSVVSSLGAPLGTFVYNLPSVPRVYIDEVDLPIPVGELRAYQYGTEDPAMEMEILDWGTLNPPDNTIGYSCVQERDDLSAITISYIKIFRKLESNGGFFQYRIKAYRAYYGRDSLVMPLRIDVLRLGVDYTISNLSQVNSYLKQTKLIPQDATMTTVAGTIYDWNNVSSPASVPVWDLQTYLDWGTGETITMGDPIFGFSKVRMNIVKEALPYAETASLGYRELIKSMLVNWGLGMRAYPGGGIEVFPHLLYAIGSGTPIVISDTDIISFTAKGTVYDIDKFAKGITACVNGDIAERILIDYYKAFGYNIRATYSIELPRSYYDNDWQPFQPITIYGKTLYVNKWSEPLYSDTFRLEALGEII